MTDSMADRMPPQDLEAEQATLGAMLMERGAVSRARQILADADDFYREAHRRIYSAICEVDDAGDPVDVTTAGAVLRRREQLAAVGGGEYLTRLIGEVPTTAHVIRYATIVRECAHRRELISVGSELQSLGYDGALGGDELNNAASDRLRRWAATSAEAAATRRIGADGYRETLERDLQSAPGISLARSGILSLDKATGGWAGHSVIVAMAGTKTGKSILGQQCILTSARQFRDNAPGTFALAYILEAYGVWRRRACGWIGRFNSQTFRRGPAGMDVIERWQQAEKELNGLPLLVNDSLRDINAICRDARHVVDDAANFGGVERVGLILIDHAQRLDGPGRLVEKYEHIGLELERLANELQTPIILPSQVTVNDGRAQTKWSRAIEENASMVMHMTRGDDDERPEVQMMRNWGELRCTRTREDTFGVIPYYVDLGGDDPRYRSDLRMYDTDQWEAMGWPTREQQLKREEVERQRDAGYERG